ncbi:MAG: DUF92 domain-containing protein [Terriglobales bacterium]
MSPSIGMPPIIIAGATVNSDFVAVIRHNAVPAALVSLVFAMVAHRMGSVSRSGAAAGAAVSFLLYAVCGLQGFLVLGVLFLITAGTTRLGKDRKRRLGIGEHRRGRNGWQVLANVSAAALLAVVALYASRPEILLASVAALAEAAADTAASEVGKALSSHVYLITTFRRVDVGSDGGISVIGTLSGIAAALLTAMAAAVLGLVPARWLPAAFGAAVFGSLLDSFLGATVQRSGWLNNSAVNFLSTIAAAAIAVFLLL